VAWSGPEDDHFSVLLVTGFPMVFSMLFPLGSWMKPGSRKGDINESAIDGD